MSDIISIWQTNGYQDPLRLIADGEGATFDGASSITYDVSGENQYVQTRRDNFKMRFLTSQGNGLLFYADSNQGDHFILELIRGRLYFHIDLGENKMLFSISSVPGALSKRGKIMLFRSFFHNPDCFFFVSRVNSKYVR